MQFALVILLAQKSNDGSINIYDNQSWNALNLGENPNPTTN